MKSFKNMLMIVAIFAVASMNAKQMGARRTMPGGGAVMTPTNVAPITPAFKPLPMVPVSTKKQLPATPTSLEDKADREIEAELAKIEKNNDAIKNITSRILKDTKINVQRKNNFMKKVKNTYDLIMEASQEDWNAMVNLFENEIAKAMTQEEEMSEEEMRMRRE
jgi:hypothetical protein